MASLKQYAAELVEQNLDDAIWDREIAADAEVYIDFLMVARDLAPGAADLQLLRAARALTVAFDRMSWEMGDGAMPEEIFRAAYLNKDEPNEPFVLRSALAAAAPTFSPGFQAAYSELQTRRASLGF